ncbi:acetyl-CoA hydrolase/transferase family protein [Pseudoxanthomonas suwonensis]|uniref:acetyl-CoA hydrolase/transferase family protein n=1 Tax=Pseudoxanthomonas suwonensis TaxID=314722 RepID=UPI00138F03EC|nr:acetyl-CoA hydrolase/transferase family protein [Pseudoxanthomonas suwonensis]KAF1705699.1 propionyl-CoA--succinate CoA transferase [Pseudoxanthomonas suwonensis]
MNERIAHAGLASRLMSAEQAAALIQPGMAVGMSGFTGAGYPKAVPKALASRIEAAHGRGEQFAIRILTGASTAPELDGVLARAGGIEFRLPYQSDPELRGRINGGQIEYMDVHLGHVAQHALFGFLGRIDLAIVEVTAILPDGRLVPSTSVGNNKTWLDLADKVIIEVNHRQPRGMEGMHDVYYGTAKPPHRKPIPLTHPGDRIGEPYLKVDLDKVVAVVESDAPDRIGRFAPIDDVSRAIAGHLVEFFRHEIRAGRLGEQLLPLQSGVGNIANAVLAGLHEGGFRGLTAFTEVIQDGMLDLIGNGTIDMASATSFSLSPEGVEEFARNIDLYREKIVLRPQEISNHAELVRRLGVIGMNGMVEADLYGNVNSTHVCGTSIINGIGGSGDFARNGFMSCFLSPSTAKNGAISAFVPMVSHVDHTEHDVAVLVSEQGLADLRGLSPKQRARAIINNCAHPDYRPMLQDYYDRALRDSKGRHTPHLLAEALSWHQRFLDTGTMKA